MLAAYFPLETFYRVVAEAHNLAAAETDQVIVMLMAVRMFVVRTSLATTGGTHDPALDEERQNPVYAGSRNIAVILSEPQEERVGVEVSVDGEDFFEDGEPLRRELQALLFEEGCELAFSLVGGAHRRVSALPAIEIQSQLFATMIQHSVGRVNFLRKFQWPIKFSTKLPAMPAEVVSRSPDHDTGPTEGPHAPAGAQESR